MGLFSTKELNSMEDLLCDQLGDLYDAEQRLTKALPKMAGAATDPQLKAGFEHHLKETKGQVRRLEEAFKLLGKDPKAVTCDAIKGLISEGDEVIKASGDPEIKDAALIAAAQRVEHYEIAGYGCARNFALRNGSNSVATLLQETLDEEKATDQKLTDMAESSINVKAAH
ncbi:YciE/YciF ferroxidase family protein [Tautonia marina]|uniref:YciE/YciF ferroxidase family protein n=1 Tax=Tautonia marina TaxID=2653855 RepID=UPI001260CCB1|nr:ferritin-like domain-containing protein [Tautonia marina]